MKELTKKDLAIIEKIKANKEIQKGLKKLHHYDSEAFLRDAKAYILAIKKNSMFCIIDSVSKSGMSRVLRFQSYVPGKRGYYRNYFALFKALGYVESNYGFRVHGCGMDMVFHTNYSIIHEFYNLGIISQKQCNILAQNTPTKF